MKTAEGTMYSPVLDTEVPVVVIQCEKCNGLAFRICFIQEQSQAHLHCVTCHASYCQSGCCSTDGPLSD